MSDKDMKFESIQLQELMTVGLELSQEQGNPAFVQNLMNQLMNLKVKVEDQERIIADLEKDARTDALTGLANRRVFEAELKRSVAAARRYKRLSALLVLDLDGFKAVNDQLGHMVGDEVLVHVAKLLKQNTRPTDIVSRLGGDEFCVILNEVRSRNDAERRSKTLNDTINQSLCLVSQKNISLSASIGTYTFGENDDVEGIINKADQLMYSQKQRKSERIQGQA